MSHEGAGSGLSQHRKTWCLLAFVYLSMCMGGCACRQELMSSCAARRTSVHVCGVFQAHGMSTCATLDRVCQGWHPSLSCLRVWVHCVCRVYTVQSPHGSAGNFSRGLVLWASWVGCSHPAGLSWEPPDPNRTPPHIQVSPWQVPQARGRSAEPLAGFSCSQLHAAWTQPRLRKRKIPETKTRPNMVRPEKGLAAVGK